MRFLVWVGLVLFGCTESVPEIPTCAQWPRSEPTCTDSPELCDLPVESAINEPDLHAAFDLVFVPDGYPAEALHEFDFLVDALTTALKRDPTTIVGRAVGQFNVHRVRLATEGAGKGYPSTFGVCVEDGSLRGDFARARLAGSSAPDADVVVVLVRGEGGRAVAALPKTVPSVVLLPVVYDWRVLDHELGHAIVHLGDEYTRSGERACFEAPRPVASSHTGLEPEVFLHKENLSIHGSGARWGSGSEKGGHQHPCGVYHPKTRCRMNQSTASQYCPVCDAAIDRVLAAPTGPLSCHVTVSAAEDEYRFAAHSAVWARGLNTALLGPVSVPMSSAVYRVLAQCSDHAGRAAARAVDVRVDDDTVRVESIPLDTPWAAVPLAASQGGRWRAEAPIEPGVQLPGCYAREAQAVFRLTAPSAGRWKIQLENGAESGLALGVFWSQRIGELGNDTPECSGSWVDGEPAPIVVELQAGETVHITVTPRVARDQMPAVAVVSAERYAEGGR